MSESLHRFADLARRVAESPARLGRVRVVAVDGPAGSGKTSFSARLCEHLRGEGLRVAEVHTDDLLEGWTDLVTFWPRLQQWVIEPLRRGESARYHKYDWIHRRFSDEWTLVILPDVLVIEGVSAARAQAAPYLTLSVFLWAPRDVRLARGIERDGEALRPNWLRWMADEDRHFAADRTAERVDLIVDGAPSVPHEEEDEFVLLPITAIR